MSDTPNQEDGLPASLRFLKGLVITLMVTMIVGVITVVGLLVTRMPDGRVQIPTVPPDITLPQGQSVQAVTFGKGYTLVITSAQNLLIYDAAGNLVQQQDLTALGIKP